MARPSNQNREARLSVCKREIEERMASNDKGAPVAEQKRYVLIGTYKGDQLTKWKGFYNYPIGDKDKISKEDAAKINELWLFNGTKAQKNYKAEFVGIKTRKELVNDYGYPAKGKAHGDRYLLFKTEFKYRHKNDNSLNCEQVILRLKDFAASAKIRRQLKNYLESPDRSDPDLAKMLPSIVTKVSPAQLHVCESTYQMMFDFTAVSPQMCKEAQDLIADAHRDGKLACVEICAGAGGQAIGLERAGFAHVALVEYEQEYCDVLKKNNPSWNVLCADVREFDGRPYSGVDLLAGGVPCPPFSVASKQLGQEDDRDLFPEALRLLAEIKPRAVMIENVRGLLDPKFDSYRNSILRRIDELGYDVQIKLLQASDYGVPQIRPRVLIVGIRKNEKGHFSFPVPCTEATPSVGEALRSIMGSRGWRHLESWVKRANRIAPTIVGGSKKHGGPDLGPTRARKAWAELGVDGLGVANEPPDVDFEGMPRLTKEMLATIQGFPAGWDFGKKKTSACRMIGNAFPPPVAEAVGVQIKKGLNNDK